ncbi:hypothetical protein V8C86DRAFT_788413 [Haematococcus lacustris]
MDAVREHLEKGDGAPAASGAGARPGFIWSLLTLVSRATVGTASQQLPWWSPARLYQWLSASFKPTARPPAADEDEWGERDDPSDPWVQAVNRQAQQLGPLLLLPRHRIRRMAIRYPRVLELDAADVGARLLSLKALLRGADVVYLMEQHPMLFLMGSPAEMEQRVGAGLAQLQRELKGANITALVMVDPELLFMDLDHGLRELRQLWDVDEQALDNSEPHELAFAVRSLCNTSPRHRQQQQQQQQQQQR